MSYRGPLIHRRERQPQGMQTEHLLRQQVQKIVASGALGRSRSYARLLEFLVDCATSGRTQKELEIAMEVFSKG
ncbi:MAG TPA: hypothetical protein VFB99_03155, partial [Vicinamibacterales bacterium]|nr:hypothetical protein [Vicinamibacterales bacterium]